MPRNAAKKPIIINDNEQDSLPNEPIATASVTILKENKTKTTTAATIIKHSNINGNNRTTTATATVAKTEIKTTTTTAGELQKQQEQSEDNNVEDQSEVEERNITSKITTARKASKKTFQSNNDNDHEDEGKDDYQNANGNDNTSSELNIIKSNINGNGGITNASSAPAAESEFRLKPLRVTTLYPIVIETVENPVISATSPTTAATKEGKENSTIFKKPKNLPPTLVLKRNSKSKSSSLNIRRDATRLASLRTRKANSTNNNNSSSTSALKNSNKNNTANNDGKEVTNHTEITETVCEDSKKQYFNKSVNNTSSRIHYANSYLDVADLNKIEVLDTNVKEKRNTASCGGRKRKRGGLRRITTPATTRSRTSIKTLAVAAAVAPPALSNNSNRIEAKLPLLQPLEIDVGTDDSYQLSGSSSPTSSRIFSDCQIKSRTTSKLELETINSGAALHTVKKRLRTMSMYERHYQNNDDGRGVITNGYLNAAAAVAAATRNGSAMNTDMDAHDVLSQQQQQYYTSSAAALSVGGSAAPSSAMSISSSSGAGGGGGGSGGGSVGGNGGGGTLITHAMLPSMGTLCNIGNTCYLNSVVYTLRFAPQFLHNLHHLIVDLATIQQTLLQRHRAKTSSLGRGINAMPMENAARSWSSKDLASLEQIAAASAAAAAVSSTGSNGKHNGSGSGGGGGGISNFMQKTTHQLLTERLHELYQSLHRNEMAESTEPFHADTLLHAVQDVSTIFEGNQQQDAHEFLMCLLNSIRETSQTLINAIIECPDVIANGYICNPRDDPLDGSATYNRDNPANNAITNNNSSTSPSTSNITKASFFSRKSKRKEEAKNLKNLRLQSPLKDVTIATTSTTTTSNNNNNNNSNLNSTSSNSNAAYGTSNSLFYLNTVDLSTSQSSDTAPVTPTTVSTLKNPSSPATVNIESSTTTSALAATSAQSSVSTNISLLTKDKQRLVEKIRELGLDFFNEDFEGITVSTTKCLSCETVTEQKESMIDIAVPVPISGYESNDYTEKCSTFIQKACVTREYFRGENKYRCEQCTGYTEAIRSISYEVLPRLLIIQLSRFSGGMEKINSYIPTSFTLQCFCAKCCELSDANKLHIYKLYSVITHVGATMSVGHYIAYTCSLDVAAEYANCPKDKRSGAAAGGTSGSGSQQPTELPAIDRSHVIHYSSTTTPSASAPLTAASSAAAALASSGTSLMKKMKFVRSKASSSGDMSKNMKNINGLTAASKTITDSISKLSMNTTCHSLNCCSTRLQQQQQHLHDLTDEAAAQQNQSGNNHNAATTVSTLSSTNYNAINYPAGYGSTGRGGYKTSYACSGSSNSSSSMGAGGIASGSNSTLSSSSAETIWYMCDDDKIKAMSQREFEDLLSPARKITVTPYLLFYARFDLQTPQQPSNTPPKHSAATSSSWSNESLHSGGGGGGGSALHKM